MPRKAGAAVKNSPKTKKIARRVLREHRSKDSTVDRGMKKLKGGLAPKLPKD